VQAGTGMLGGANVAGGEASPDADPVPLYARGADGTLLAVVPIPGTETSLAIVGYPVPAGPGIKVRSPGGTAVAGLGHAVKTALADQFIAGQAGLVLDHDQRRVWADGAEVPLTFQEFELLAFLAAHPVTVFSRADLVREVWQRDFAADSRTVDVHISRLRRKLGSAHARCLVTEYRVGYQFRPL
jgi:Transcriptional regulatory protein, C terminal